jgi:hypothetical protein
MPLTARMVLSMLMEYLRSSRIDRMCRPPCEPEDRREMPASVPAWQFMVQSVAFCKAQSPDRCRMLL